MAPIDPSSNPAKEVLNHGMALDPENKRVQCCYCGIVFSGFNLLQHHLGRIRGDAVACEDVPEEVMGFFRGTLVSQKVRNLVNEIGHLHHTGSPAKKRCSSNGIANDASLNQAARSPNGHVQVQKPRLQTESGSSSNATLWGLRTGSNGIANDASLHQATRILNAHVQAQKPRLKTELGSSSNARLGGLRTSSTGIANDSSLHQATRSLNDHVQAQKPRLPTELASSSNARLEGLKTCSGKEGLNMLAIMTKRSIGKFFFENAIDFAAVKTSSFQNMMGYFLKSDSCTPSIADLKGWILEDEMTDIEKYVKKVRLSWPRTGCSILLDGWTDHLGRDLINVIVDCPEGPIYLRSADVSPATKGGNALQLFLEMVLEEVGIQNVVQIVAHSYSDKMEALSRRLIEKYSSFFWTVSATHCMSLILEKIALTTSIKLTLEKAKTLTKFIYSRPSLLQLLREHIDSPDLVRASKIKVAASFLTLESILIEQRNIERMFTSYDWVSSHWASTVEGKRVANLVNDISFWAGVIHAVKASIPVVKAMSLINEDGEPHLGYIYETMDQIKETIGEEFGGKKSQYDQYWTIIDDVWNGILHSPLHAAGYYLNPRLHFTEDFFSDPEVAGGLLITVVRMVGDKPTQDKVSEQIDLYRNHSGEFNLGIEKNKRDNLSPAAWWSRFGSHCVELQEVAIKVLSQTCNGAESYGLRRDLAEKLLNSGGNITEQQHLRNLTYLHYNLWLKHSKVGGKFNIIADDMDPTNDWVVDELYNADAVQSRTGLSVQAANLGVGTSSSSRTPMEGHGVGTSSGSRIPMEGHGIGTSPGSRIRMEGHGVGTSSGSRIRMEGHGVGTSSSSKFRTEAGPSSVVGKVEPKSEM